MTRLAHALRRVSGYAAALFLTCGVVVAVAAGCLLNGAQSGMAAPAAGVGLLLSLTWLGIGTALATLALTERQHR